MTRKQADRYIYLVKTLDVHQDVLDKLLRYSNKLSAIAERQCNGYQIGNTGRADLAQEQRDERAETRTLARAEELAAQYGWKVYHQGDPRGCSLYLYRPDADLRGHGIDSMYSSVGVAVCL